MRLPTDPLVIRAMELAMDAHRGQTRRDKVTPYLYHVMAVAQRAPQDPVSQAVAVLHDTLEGDCAQQLTYGEILTEVSPEVAVGVDTLTRKAHEESYEEYIQRIAESQGGKWVAIKVADLLSNLADSPTRAQITRYAKALLVLVPPLSAETPVSPSP